MYIMVLLVFQPLLAVTVLINLKAVSGTWGESLCTYLGDTQSGKRRERC